MALTVYATVDDLAARRTSALTDDEKTVAAILLADASAYIASVANIDTANETQAQNAKAVCCELVEARMTSGESGLYGVSQFSQTAGPYTLSTSFHDPSGSFFLTKSQRRRLGAGRASISSTMPVIGWGSE